MNEILVRRLLFCPYCGRRVERQVAEGWRERGELQRAQVLAVVFMTKHNNSRQVKGLIEEKEA